MKLNAYMKNVCGKEIGNCTNEELYGGLSDSGSGRSSEKRKHTGKEKAVLYFSRISDRKTAVEQPDQSGII